MFLYFMTNSNPVGKVRMLLRVLFAFLVRFQACGSNPENEHLQSDRVFCSKLQLAQILSNNIIPHAFTRLYSSNNNLKDMSVEGFSAG